jgi:hypothetical protein
VQQAALTTAPASRRPPTTSSPDCPRIRLAGPLDHSGDPVSLSFRNSTPGPISLVYAHNDSGCGSGGDAWMKEGWWSISPGGTVTVRGGPVNGAKYFFFAEGGTGQTWAGEFTTTVPLQAFSQCWNIGTTDSQQVSMRKIEVPITSFNHTVNLTI